MKKLLIILILLLSINYLHAQINAITETGDEVLLYPDGTWAYLNDSLVEAKTIEVNEKKFTKSKSASFLVKSKKLNIGVWINPKHWTFERANENDASEFNFTRKGEDLYAMLISEKMEIPIVTLKQVAFENAREVAPDIKIVNEEYRFVNGIMVYMMQMNGSIQGMRVTYCGYYYSNSNGTIQLITYTAANLFDDYKDQVEELLNGLVEL